MGIIISSKGSFQKTDRFLSKLSKGDIFASLEPHAQRGVVALASATPVESGQTAASWTFEIVKGRNVISIYWKNTHLDPQGVPIAILLQFGHGTGTGGYVQGRDYINPAIRPIFDEIANSVWREVTSA